jgi:hypothetical protein
MVELSNFLEEGGDVGLERRLIAEVAGMARDAVLYVVSIGNLGAGDVERGVPLQTGRISSTCQ